MGKVVIKCPTTGKVIPTGMASDKSSFESSQFVNNIARCPACGQKHVWNKADAWLQPNQPT